MKISFLLIIICTSLLTAPCSAQLERSYANLCESYYQFPDPPEVTISKFNQGSSFQAADNRDMEFLEGRPRLELSSRLTGDIFTDYIFRFLIVGLLLFAFLYNTLLFVLTRDRIYLPYTGYVLFVIVFYLSPVPYIVPDQQVSAVLFYVSSGIAFQFAIYFAIVFLQTKKYTPRLHVILQIMRGIYIFGAVFAFFFREVRIEQPFEVAQAVSTILMYSSAIIAYRKGYKPARYYILGWTILLLFAVMQSLVLSNLLPFLSYDVGQKSILYLIPAGFAIEVIVFSLALADRINHYKKEKEEANKQKIRAELSDKFKLQFLANMSHEIRTPMHAVMGMTDLALKGKIDEKTRSYLENIEKSSDNLLHIVNDILDLSKIEAGKMELETIDISLADTVDHVKQTLLHKAEERGLELISRIDPSVNDIVLCDPVRLNQVLINLTGNAIKFTENGSVFIELKEVNEKVRFSVIDTGIGIPKEKIQSVFESFSQASVSDTRNYGGVGLGLSISQQLVGLMHGSISIESEEGKGTTFFFDLALEKGDINRLEQRLAAEENVDGSILDGLTIMIADDNEYNRIVASDTLQSRARIEIVEAENGQEAIDKLTEDIDVILMDAQMPILSGYDATRMIRKTGNNIPIIALTASVMRTDLDRCIDAGMNGYIPKPFKAHDLITGIAKALNIELKLDRSTKKEVKQKSNSSDSVTDLTYLREFCEGDKSKMLKYIDTFLKSAPPFLEKLEELMHAEDAEGIANHVHGFNTKLTMMGMKETKSLSIEIENELRGQDQLNIPLHLLNRMVSIVKCAISELQNIK